MYPLGGFAEAPLSSHPSEDFLLISLPRGLKTLVDVPFLSLLGVIFWEFSAAQKLFQSDFLSLETEVWGHLTYS